MAHLANNLIVSKRDRHIWRSKLIRGRLLIVFTIAAILITLDYFDHDGPQHPAWQDGDFWFGFPIYGLIVPALVWIILKWSSRLLEERNSVELQMAATSEFGMLLTSLNQPEKLEQEVIRFCKEVAPGAEVSFYGFDQEQGRYLPSAESLTSQSGEGAVSPNGCFACLNVSNVGGSNQVLGCRQYPLREHKPYCLPIQINHTRLGLLQIYPPAAKGLDNQQLNTFAAAEPEIAFALMNRTLEQDKLKNLSQAANECHQIAWDLHDHLGQDVTYLRLKLEQLQFDFDRQSKIILKRDLTRLLAVADIAYDQVSKTLSMLYAEDGTSWQTKLEKLGLSIASKSGFNFTFDHEGTEQPLPVELGQTIYYICREALNNVAEHANADQVTMKISWMSDHLMVEMSDDGRGFNLDTATVGSNFGLRIMRERAAIINSTLIVHSEPALGTKVGLSIPYPGTAARDLVDHSISLTGVTKSFRR